MGLLLATAAAHAAATCLLIDVIRVLAALALLSATAQLPEIVALALACHAGKLREEAGQIARVGADELTRPPARASEAVSGCNLAHAGRSNILTGSELLYAPCSRTAAGKRAGACAWLLPSERAPNMPDEAADAPPKLEAPPDAPPACVVGRNCWASLTESAEAHARPNATTKSRARMTVFLLSKFACFWESPWKAAKPQANASACGFATRLAHRAGPIRLPN